MADADGVWKLRLTTESDIPPRLDAAIASMDRAEARANRIRAEGGLFNRVLGRVLPGGGLANALGAGIGGGVGATIGVGTAFAGAQLAKTVVSNAQEMDTNAEARAAAVAQIIRYSDATTTSLASLGSQMEVFFGVLTRQVANIVATGYNLARIFISYPATGLARAGESLAGKLGLSDIAGALGSFADWSADEGARGYQDLTGDTGDQDIGRAQARLDAAKEKRRASSRSPSRGGSSYAPQADEFAKMGLFIGGGGADEMVTLTRDQNRKLDMVIEKLGSLPRGIAETL